MDLFPSQTLGDSLAQQHNQQQHSNGSDVVRFGAAAAAAVAQPLVAMASAAAQQAISSSQSAAASASTSVTSTTTNILGLNLDSSPILYMEPNRTSAIYEDIRTVLIYISFATLLFSFLIVFPGIRHDKIPTFIVIPTSLLVTCIILIALTGSNWHVGEAPISAAYKAFSRDRIQGDLSVRIGLQSVNITLRAHKHYILHSSQGPMVMMTMNKLDQQDDAVISKKSQQQQQQTLKTLKDQKNEFINKQPNINNKQLDEATSSDATENPFILENESSSSSSPADVDVDLGSARVNSASGSRSTRQNSVDDPNLQNNSEFINIKGQKYRIEKIDVDINYNERFYWIEPNQMRQEYHGALKRGLPYPILTVVEYLSQDEAGFSWSRQYRLAGYYSYILLCITLSCCALMFLFHCAAPIYAIYTLQLIGCLLLLTNFTYSILIPRDDQSLVIPFEGQNLTFKFGMQYWLVFFGGCAALVIGSALAIINIFWPLTTILDHEFDSHSGYYRHRKRKQSASGKLCLQRPIKPPSNLIKTTTSSSSSSKNHSSLTCNSDDPNNYEKPTSTPTTTTMVSQQQHGHLTSTENIKRVPANVTHL